MKQNQINGDNLTRRKTRSGLVVVTAGVLGFAGLATYALHHQINTGRSIPVQTQSGGSTVIYSGEIPGYSVEISEFCYRDGSIFSDICLFAKNEGKTPFNISGQYNNTNHHFNNISVIRDGLNPVSASVSFEKDRWVVKYFPYGQDKKDLSDLELIKVKKLLYDALLTVRTEENKESLGNHR